MASMTTWILMRMMEVDHQWFWMIMWLLKERASIWSCWSEG